MGCKSADPSEGFPRIEVGCPIGEDHKTLSAHIAGASLDLAMGCGLRVGRCEVVGVVVSTIVRMKFWPPMRWRKLTLRGD